MSEPVYELTLGPQWSKLEGKGNNQFSNFSGSDKSGSTNVKTFIHANGYETKWIFVEHVVDWEEKARLEDGKCGNNKEK